MLKTLFISSALILSLSACKRSEETTVPAAPKPQVTVPDPSTPVPLVPKSSEPATLAPSPTAPIPE